MTLDQESESLTTAPPVTPIMPKFCLWPFDHWSTVITKARPCFLIATNIMPEDTAWPFDQLPESVLIIGLHLDFSCSSGDGAYGTDALVLHMKCKGWSLMYWGLFCGLDHLSLMAQLRSEIAVALMTVYRGDQAVMWLDTVISLVIRIFYLGTYGNNSILFSLDPLSIFWRRG